MRYIIIILVLVLSGCATTDVSSVPRIQQTIVELGAAGDMGAYLLKFTIHPTSQITKTQEEWIFATSTVHAVTQANNFLGLQRSSSDVYLFSLGTNIDL